MYPPTKSLLVTLALGTLCLSATAQLYNTVTLNPRFYAPRFDAALPITYSGMTGAMKLGLGLRTSVSRIGSNDLRALVLDNGTGVNFYFGSGAAINRPSR